MAILRRNFETMIVILEANRPITQLRQAIIATTPALREREMSKQASLIVAAATALAKRGEDARTASLAAQLGAAAFNHALATWSEDPFGSLAAHFDRAFEQMRLLSS